MLKLNKKAEGSVSTAIKLVTSIVLGGAILFSATAMINNTVVPGMVNIFEAEHSEGVSVSGDSVSAEIEDAINEHNGDEHAHEDLFNTKADIQSLNTKADRVELDSKANISDLDNLVTKSVVQSLANDVAALKTQANSSLDVYPIGSIYLSVSNASPSVLFGGTWEQIEDRFLLSAGDDYNAGDNGGEAYHILTVDEIPSHTHTVGSRNQEMWNIAANIGDNAISDTAVVGNGTQSDFNKIYGPLNMDRYQIGFSTIQSTGGGQAHNNMPPYLVVYMWKRTA